MSADMSILDFAAEKVAERDAVAAEDERIMDLLGRFTAGMLMDALRSDGGHPRPEWGDDEEEPGSCVGSWRFYYLDECRRRGLRLLDQLGWPRGDDALYVNLHTGSVDTLWNIATTRGYFADRYTVASQVWSVVEHWEPYDPNKPNVYKVKYLRERVDRLKLIKSRGKIDAYNRNEIKGIPDYEAEIRDELEKGEMIMNGGCET
jgi:hypothetical protein